MVRIEFISSFNDRYIELNSDMLNTSDIEKNSSSILVEDQLKNAIHLIYSRADSIIQYFIYIFFIAGLVLGIFNKDWITASALAGGGLVIFLVTKVKSISRIHYVFTSISLGILITHLVYQIHGPFELYFASLILFPIFLLYEDVVIIIAYAATIVLANVLLGYFYFNKDISITDLFNGGINKDSPLLYYYLFLFVQVIACSGIASLLKRKAITNIKENIHWSTLSKSFSKNIEFAQAIASGNLDAEYDLAKGDNLGKSLLDMRDNLKITTEESKNRNWATEGIAKIEEILRLNNNNLDTLSSMIISYLVKYLGGNQGAIFIVNNDNNESLFLELKGVYAYDTKEFIEKKVEFGQGLLGQAVKEKDVILITEFPENYIQIVSGLGEATPKAIVIVPLRMEEEVVGAIEIASFYDFEKYQVEFLKKVAESIASAVITSKNNYKTSILLAESQELAGLLKAQEEQMRQNMEELQSTQEELQRNNSEFEEFMEIFNDYAVRIEYDKKGNILNISDKLSKLIHFDKSDVANKKFNTIIPESHLAEFDEAFWEGVVKNNINEKNVPFKSKEGEVVWLKAYFKPVEYMPGVVRKVNMIGYPVAVE